MTIYEIAKLKKSIGEVKSQHKFKATHGGILKFLVGMNEEPRRPS